MSLRRHGVRRLPSGGVRVTISQREREALASLPAHLRPIVSGEADDPVSTELRARFYPPAYDDAERDAEYHELAADELIAGRVDSLDLFTESLEQEAGSGVSWSVELTPEQAQAWLAVCNDARLMLAGIVGIESEEQWEAGPDPADPASLLLWYLGWLEEELVTAMMGSLPDA